MEFRPFAGLFLTLLALSSLTRAEPPQLTGTMPLGVQRGKTTEVSLHGTGMSGELRLVAPFVFQLEEIGGTDRGDTTRKVRLLVSAGTAVGVYPIRVVTEEGISNPVLFAVGQVPQVAEVEPNNRAETAQAISVPVVVEAQATGNDVDFFRFAGRKGNRIVVDALCARIGSGVDPSIRLTTSDGRFVASADDTPGLFTDGYLSAELPEDGDYLVELCDSRYAGTGRAAYRLLIGPVPYAQEAFPHSLPRGRNTALQLRGGTLSAARLFALRAPADPMQVSFLPSIPARLLADPAWADSELDVELPLPLPLGDSAEIPEPADPAQPLPPLPSPVAIVGALSEPGQRDAFTITAPPDSRHEIRVEAWNLGSALDGQLRILGKDGRLLGEADDGKGGSGRRGAGGGGRRPRNLTSTDPAFDLTMPRGEREVKLVVKDLMDRGGPGFHYRLVVQPVETAFQLNLSDDTVAIPRGGTALIPVTVTRGGYRGPIALEIRGLPADRGVTAYGGTVFPGQDSGVVALHAAADSPHQVCELQLVGKGDDGRPVAATGSRVFASQTISTPGFGMAGTIPSHVRPFASLTAAVVRPASILLKPETTRLTVARGSTVELPVEVVRTSREKSSLTLAAVSPPAGLSVTEAKLEDRTTRVILKVTASPNAPTASVLLGLAAREAQRENSKAREASEAVRNLPPAAAAAAAITVEVVATANPK